MRIVLVGLDGLRPDAATPDLMPNLARLAAQGTRFAHARSVFPSETRVAMPSIATGCRPASHGMVANTIFDRATAPDRLLRTNKVEDLQTLAAGAASPVLRPGLGEILAAAGRSLAVVSAGSPGMTVLLHPLAEAAGACRWNVADEEGPWAARIRERLGPAPAAVVPNLARTEFAARAMTEVVLPDLCPDVAILWCPEPDVTFHYQGLGGAAARAALAGADAALGRVMAWRDAQPDAAEIAIIAMSDHGHVTGPRKIGLAAELRRAGFAAGEGMAEGTDIVVAPAGAPGMWFRDPGLMAPVAAWLAQQDWAGPLLARDPAALPGTMPLALLDAGHARSADLVLLFAGGEGPDAHGLPGTAPFDAADVPEGGGMHGGLHRRELATVLVAEGGPFRRGATVQAMADLSDIAPTVLHLLGVAQEGMDGRALAEGWDAAADGAPDPALVEMGRGFVLEAARQSGRFYPTALRRG